MPNLERGGYGVSVDGPLGLIDGLRLGGVVLPGSIGYDCYPQAAAGVAAVTSGSADTLGSDADIIAASTITTPFYLMGVAIALTDVTVARYRWAVKVNTVLSRSSLFDPRGATGPANGQSYYDYWSPVPCPANAAVSIAAACSEASANTTRSYAQVLLKPPRAMDPSLLSESRLAVQTLLPNSTTGVALTSGANFATYGSYVQITASISTPILITKIIHSSATQNLAYQIALSTGAAASEVDFAVVGAALGNIGDIENTTVFYAQYPILINAGTRIAARVRDNSGGSAGYAVWIEYYPVPAL